MNDIEVIDGSPNEGERIAMVLYECESRAETIDRAMADLARRAREIYAQWAARPQSCAEGTRVALDHVSTFTDAAGGRHAAEVSARIVVIGPRDDVSGRRVSDNERRRLGPTLADHRAVLARALARFESGEPVDTSRLWQHAIPILLADEG